MVNQRSPKPLLQVRFLPLLPLKKELVMKIVQTVKRIPQFFREVQQELKKVSWSSRKELLGATWVVIFATFALALYIGSIDFGLSKFLTSVLQ